MTDNVLLAGDVDAIKEFVFETSSLPQIRGGSELLLDCEEAIQGNLRQKYGYEAIYCGGGSFLLEVAPERVEEVRRAIESLYLDTTGIATVTMVYERGQLEPLSHVPSDGWAGRLVYATQDAVRAGEFSRRIAALAAQMQEAKTRKSTAPFYETFPFGRRCDRCGKRMAVSRDLVEPNKALCPICELRDSKGREERKRIHGRDIRGRFNQEFWQEYGAPYAADQPQDLDTLIGTARRGYLAFLYADGNDIGRLLQTVRSEKEYRALSGALAEGTKRALYEAIQAVCGQALKEEGYWPFDIVNVGGDDVMLLVQAGYAWEVAVKFLECFEQEVNKRVREALVYWPEGWPEQITASCGIAIADVKYPMRYFARLATDLLKEAKKLAKRDRNRTVSTATFLWLPTPVASEKAEPLMSFYTRYPTEGLPCELTARPYTLEQAREVQRVAREIAQWPRTLRHRWAEALEKGVMASVNLIHYDVARRSEVKRREMYQTLVQAGRIAAPDAKDADIPAPIWYLQKGHKTLWRTALLDVLELAELEAMRPEIEEEAE